MASLVRAFLFVSAVSLFAGCGATVGDPCTVVSDCGDALCLNSQEYTPGGYCSRQCTLDDDKTCPNGSVCIRDGAAKDIHACFRSCKTNTDCRGGYTCQAIRGRTDSVCAGPNA